MAKNLIVGLILTCFGPNLVPKIFLRVLLLLDVINCCKLSLYAISRKTNDPNLKKWQKTQIHAQLRPLWPKLGSKKIFSGFYLYQILYISQIHWHCTRYYTKGPDFGPFGPNLYPKNIFCEFYLDQMLEIVASYHCMLLQDKLMNQT